MPYSMSMARKQTAKKSLMERLVDEGIFATRDIAEKQIRAGLVRVDSEVVCEGVICCA